MFDLNMGLGIGLVNNIILLICLRLQFPISVSVIARDSPRQRVALSLQAVTSQLWLSFTS